MPRAPPADPPIQLLCDECARAVADGNQPETAKAINRIMDSLTAADLGLKGAGDRGGSSETIRTHSIYEGSDFEVVIFLFPAGARIPFHDHPGMTVFSKVIYGALSMVSVDWNEPLSREEVRLLNMEQERQDQIAEMAPNSSQLAANEAATIFASRGVHLRANTVLNPEAPSFMLRPEFANIHCFEAQSECAVLDVLLPPYNDDDRNCHYFELLPEGADPSTATELRLRVIAPPDSLEIRRGQYLGPAVRPPR